MKKRMCSRFLSLLCAAALMLSGFGVFAADEYKYVSDEAGVLAEDTKQYIEENLSRINASYDNINMTFKTITADRAPKNGIDTGLVVPKINTDSYALVWVNGLDELKFYNEEKFFKLPDEYKSIEKDIKKHSKGIGDRQTVIQDAFSIYAAGICSISNQNGAVRLPDGMKVGDVSAKEYIENFNKENDKNETIIGIAVFVGIVIVVFVIFAINKAPQGTVPGDGSNFKDGLGSGVAAISGITGPAGKAMGPGGGGFGGGAPFLK